MAQCSVCGFRCAYWSRKKRCNRRGFWPGCCFLPLFYRRSLRHTGGPSDSHSYFFILRWEWFEWLGMSPPCFSFWWFGSWAKRRQLTALHQLCSTTIVFCCACLVTALAITVPPQLVRFAELQPMRGLLLVYVFLFVVGGGLLGEYVLKTQLWRWLAAFVPIALGCSSSSGSCSLRHSTSNSREEVPRTPGSRHSCGYVATRP